MSPLSLRRRPVEPEVELDEQTAADLPPIATGTHQATSHWSTKAASAGLLTCLVLGPVGAVAGALALTQSAAPTQTSATAITDQSGDRAVVGEYAQRVVLTWLTTTQDNVDALEAMVSDVQTAAIATEPFTVRDVTVAGISEADAVWSVTVAATVTDARKQTARRFYQVPVTFTGGAVTALSLPTPVTGPVAAAGSASEYRAHVDPTSPIGQTVAEFLGAYTAGDGDVSRYVTPGVTLTAITPAPYATVKLVDLRALEEVDAVAAPADGQQLRVLAIASAVVTDTQSSGVSYALTLTARAGRWEITAIDPAPATTAPDATQAPGTAPTGAGTTPATSSSTTAP
ncbi:hypothetical protein Xcel_3436 (plasmid) [Xylanimonas cellulosilytica DSM 15894]|uniref:Conjugative transposon protein TcpC n=1 Tax=Xylanimonas cellulosilytica (strain DSM 15894 / JCM 12276 / CECT 5975 / KCTC 9989 / LMG 20990 / NBRC 107835 / XIL07) TaxID=446471 RepID=D1C0W9_XYLCX|nr:conjugal transfer protein [Xylanimonas cellulosilytica]ACZ32435.1 hypothetical protein Xcel_3436 [Xylanimonas cellulosilytica DSM 15894]